MKKIYIIHGWEGSPNEPLLKWLKNSLEEKGYKVISPEMPEPEMPKIDLWINKLNKIINQSDENTILVGHSIGCQAILRYLEKLHPTVRIGSIVFIAPWITLSNLSGQEEWDIVNPWINTPINANNIIKHTSKIISIFSDNDPYVPFEENKKMFKERFNSEIIEEKEKGHFTEDDNVKELSSALNAITTTNTSV